MSKWSTPRKGAKPITEIDEQAYSTVLSDRKRKIAETRHRTGLLVNCELILLYRNIGRDILAQQKREG